MDLFHHLAKVQYKCYSNKLYRHLGGGIVSKIVCRIIRFYYHCELPYSVDTTGVHFCHKGFCTVVHPKVTFGKGIVIQHGVTIGKTENGVPSFGNDIFIGARAIIIGNVKVGDNVRIGAGAVVVKDIPNNCTAVGVPAKIVQMKNEEGTTETYTD